MTDFLWAVVVVVAILLVLVLIVRAVAARRARPAFETRALPASYVGPYEARMVELRAMFVNNPREAVAGAKQLVDDMTMRMGYPTRMTDRERLADMAAVDRRHASRYRVGLELKPDSTTEEMRRVLQSYLDLGRELLGRRERTPAAESRREIAG
jgi:flagellar biosynthesis/type III secretory pathway M-ring protein FliF/YscJ